MLDVRKCSSEGMLRPGYLGPGYWTSDRGIPAVFQMRAESSRVILIYRRRCDGKWTNEQVIDLFVLSAGEQTEALALFNKIVAPREAISIGSGPITLTNSPGRTLKLTPRSAGTSTFPA